MVVTKVKQIKSVNKLSDGIKYIEDGAKTINSEFINSELNFPIKFINGKPVSQLVSGHLIIDVESSFSELMQLKQLANIEKGTKKSLEQISDKYADLAGAKILNKKINLGIKSIQLIKEKIYLKLKLRIV